MLNNLKQIDFLRKLRHVFNYKIRDTLIGIKVLYEEGITHFYISPDPKKLHILFESGSADGLNSIYDQSIAIIEKILNTP